MIAIICSLVVFTSCKKDDVVALPVTRLSESAVDAAAGETVTVDIVYYAEAGVKSITATKYWEENVQDSQVFEGNDLVANFEFSYITIEGDKDHAVKFIFIVEDFKGQMDDTDLIINVQ